MGEDDEACDNCQCVYPQDTLQWIGYLWYCPTCWAAYWDGDDSKLKALRTWDKQCPELVDE